jgi:hypothetical protein
MVERRTCSTLEFTAFSAPGLFFLLHRLCDMRDADIIQRYPQMINIGQSQDQDGQQMNVSETFPSVSFSLDRP